jgi:hypothetical protein
MKNLHIFLFIVIKREENSKVRFGKMKGQKPP